MAIILSHPTGNANVRAVASGILKDNLLHTFNTSIAAFQGSLLYRLSTFKPLAEIRRREFDAALKPYTNTLPWREFGRLAATKGGFQKLIKHEQGPFCIDAVYEGLDKAVASRIKKEKRNGAKGIYAYEDGAGASFLEASKNNVQCFYDLPTGYWRASRELLATEQERWPDWASTMTGFHDSQEKLKRKDLELSLANRIFVASRFVADTLKYYPGNLAPVEIIPYGFPPVTADRKFAKKTGHQRLKVLFVGKLTQQKGIADLFAVAGKVSKHIELTLVGHKATDNCEPLNNALTKHTWIPSLPHHKILELMREHDVLIFPSLFDGFGLVITEAMSQGTPVITTNRTAGPDLIEHGRNGWLVEAGNTEILQAALENCMAHPETIAEAGYNAMETARRRPWEIYQSELAMAIRKHLNM